MGRGFIPALDLLAFRQLRDQHTHLHVGTRSTLAHSIGLADTEVQFLAQLMYQFNCKRRRCGQHHAQGTEIILVHSRIPDQLQNERRNDISVGDLMALDGGAEFVEVKSGHDKGG